MTKDGSERIESGFVGDDGHSRLKLGDLPGEQFDVPAGH